MELQIVQIEICQLRDFVIINAVDILFISVSVCLSDCLPSLSLTVSFSQVGLLWGVFRIEIGTTSASISSSCLPEITIIIIAKITLHNQRKALVNCQSNSNNNKTTSETAIQQQQQQAPA